MNFILRRASETLRFLFSRASSWKRLWRSVRRWPDLFTSLRKRMMTESTLSPERVLILIELRGATRGSGHEFWDDSCPQPTLLDSSMCAALVSSTAALSFIFGCWDCISMTLPPKADTVFVGMVAGC